MFKIIKSFMDSKDNMIPVIPSLELPEPVSLNSSLTEIENFKKAFESWENHHTEILEENNLRFKKALERIKFCAFLHGFLDPFAVRLDFKDHYNWCPKKDWENSSIRYEMTQ